MYDHIRLSLPEPFITDQEKEAFFNRFNLFVKDEKKGIYHNKGYETLEQNKGIYLRYELKGCKRDSLTISFSLHKFWNAKRKRNLINYNDFTFENANEAYNEFKRLLKIDVSRSIVKKFEIGINVVTKDSPDEYLKELNQIRVQAREMRIIEDLHYKEYKQYSTHKDKDKRIIYIFYNKTYEVRSKIKDIQQRERIPDNILRIEKDYHRPCEKIKFDQLFKPEYQGTLLQEFKRNFIDGLDYKRILLKTKGITGMQLEILRHIDNNELDNILFQRKLYKNEGKITNDQYRYFKMQADHICKNKDKYMKTETERGRELKTLIFNKLKR